MGEGMRMKAKGGGESMKKDFTSLMTIMRDNYEHKLGLRNNQLNV